MRAARVLDMLLVLQRRGRLTAMQLADALEVSERTVLRDVEALGEAGVPIFTVQGAGGGIELMDGFQTHLTGLTTDEASSLFLVGQPHV
ncbi:MAG: HTH domain-containing protein, partial [Ilumatobacteraceae bacterium]|nr:HTH domain-containing protein [Ilumatobacteraceae bacterium]